MSNISILVTGSKQFTGYMEFVRAVSVAIDGLRDKESDTGKIVVYSAGPTNINQYTAEFCNVTEHTLKQYGYRISFRRVPWQPPVDYKEWGLDQVITFGMPKPHSSPYVINAVLSGIPVTNYS